MGARWGWRERLNGGKSQKVEKNGEMEWYWAGRERSGTKANNVLLKRVCVLMGKSRAVLRI